MIYRKKSYLKAVNDAGIIPFAGQLAGSKGSIPVPITHLHTWQQGISAPQ